MDSVLLMFKQIITYYMVVLVAKSYCIKYSLTNFLVSVVKLQIFFPFFFITNLVSSVWFSLRTQKNSFGLIVFTFQLNFKL